MNNPWVISTADNEKIEQINFNIKFQVMDFEILESIEKVYYLSKHMTISGNNLDKFTV